MNINKAIAVLKAAGIDVAVRPIKLKRASVARINELLTLKHKVVVSHNGKRATVFTLEGYKGRLRAGRAGAAGRWSGKEMAAK
jgi:hypothetical protein